MEAILSRIKALDIPQPAIYAAAGLLAFLVLLGLWGLFRQWLFNKRLNTALSNPGLASQLIRFRYSSGALLRRSNLIEKMSEKSGPLVVELTGMDDLWIQRLENRGGRKNLMRVLKFAPDKGLFACFMAVLRKPSLAPALMGWLEGTGDFLFMRRIALSSRGKGFDGKKAHALFKDKLDLVRELGGDPEWASRFFSCQILLHDDDEKSRQLLWDAFDDPHPLVRKTVLEGFAPEDRQAHYKKLHALFIHDPAYEVRKSAWSHIHNEFSDLYTLNPKGLGEDETLHVLELLNVRVKDDENFALTFLQSKNLEFRLLSADFLQRCGALERICQNADLGDREDMERVYKLLKAASEVNVTGFLGRVIDSTNNPASLLVCARILISNDQLTHFITPMARKVFALYNGKAELLEVYQTALKCVSQSGSEETLRLLNQELERRAHDALAMPYILENMPPRGGLIFMTTLINHFRNPDYPYRDSLRKALKQMPVPMVLPEVLAMIKSSRDSLPIPVRVDAVRLLGEMGLTYCLQTVLENLWVLPLDEAREFMSVLGDYPRDLLATKVEKLLNTSDTRIRAAIIHALPAIQEKRFIPRLKELSKDVDPDVRIACAWALSDFTDMDWKAEDMAILRDPVDRVREEAARAFGKLGSQSVLNAMKKLFSLEDESAPVKKAALLGLGHSTAPAAIDIMVEQLEKDGQYQEEILQGLSIKRSKPELTRLFDRFKDADPAIKGKLTEAFKRMGEQGGLAMAELLKEDISSLKDYILEILDATGHVEYQLRRLSHRDQAVRRTAAEFLTTVGTLPAFRGLVLAAQDPDQEVRILVIKALEKLETEDSNKILEDLSNDPVRKVRRYTQWAMERLKAKSL